jgi:hypothetical protein
MDTTVGGGEWVVLRRCHPEGWEEKARRSGALRRGRGVDGVESLLCVLVMHLLIDRLLAGRNNSACADGGPGSVERRGPIRFAAGLRGMAALAGRRAAEVVWAAPPPESVRRQSQILASRGRTDAFTARFI